MPYVGKSMDRKRNARRRQLSGAHTAETAAELRKRLEEDAQPMRAQSAPITTEERA